MNGSPHPAHGRKCDSRRSVVIRQDGTAEFLADDPVTESIAQTLGPVEAGRRASHIEPVFRPWRWAFRTLRYLFGDYGRTAKFTRHWRCRWSVDLRPSNGPLLDIDPRTFKPFASRADAIDFEKFWLAEHHLGRLQP